MPQVKRAGSLNRLSRIGTAGIRRPGITVTDDDGASDSTAVAEVVVFDRAAGPALGTGFLSSPAGAHPAKPELTGTAAFSLGAR